MNSPAPAVNSHPVCCWAEARFPRGGCAAYDDDDDDDDNDDVFCFHFA